MDCHAIIADHYPPQSRAFKLLVAHGEAVARKAIAVAKRLGMRPIDHRFLVEAAMLHDIGIRDTNSPSLGCRGKHAYICHGYLGRKLLEQNGLPRHALVCERHVGVGIGVNDIRAQNLPLPLREMLPLTMEEKIVCYADKFFSKSGNGREKSIPAIITGLACFGSDKVERFLLWHGEFDPT
jgi:uncharacterized protein